MRGALQEPAVRHDSFDVDAAAGRLARLVRDMAEAWQGAAPPAGFRLFGVGNERIVAAMADVEPLTTRSVWNMQPLFYFDVVTPAFDLSERTRSRGLDSRMLTSPRSLQLYPLMSSEYPGVRLGPARAQFILLDEATLIVAGPMSLDGSPTAWLTTRAEPVQLARDLWTATWARSRPALEPGAAPPFSARQCAVARRLVVGMKDASIARELGVSVRTVAGDVARLVRGVGATSRPEAVLMLMGRGRNAVR